MNSGQYKQRASLLKSKNVSESSFTMRNGMVEFEIEGQRVVVPTAEAFQRLLKQVAVLEQRLAVTDNKASRVARMADRKD